MRYDVLMTYTKNVKKVTQYVQNVMMIIDRNVDL